MYMFPKLESLKQKGYYPDAILDIGAHHGHWSNNMKSIYNNCPYYLFEGINYPELTHFKNRSPNTNVYNVVLNDKIDKVNWYQMKNTGDSIFREKTQHFTNCEIIVVDTIDLYR